ncbi:unnamed protein product [Paramecium pentaurelia]|uniref:Uncharacterized protein n=1 Tax=Paramecium pentaurelia TaxID=43138 RepID=A0A8S1TFD7_9CILI|nr:unnamed protein product [Paramecium pentaurelia]
MQTHQLPSCVSPRNFTNYISNGTGRDYYVVYYNGGLAKNTQVHEEGCYDRRRFLSGEYQSKGLPSLSPKFQHYQGDGTGRDFYIKINEGGQFSSLKKHNHLANLRSYDKIPQEFRSNDFLRAPQMSVKEKLKMRQLSQKQKEVLERLCSPKNKPN